MAKIVQCVPNFSEGRRPEIVEQIVQAIDGASDVRIVDYSLDEDHNRSVVTFLGAPEDIRASAFAGAAAAVDLIDLNTHKGGHPRIGAVDVIPVVPIREMTMPDAVALSYEIGKDIADDLCLPVYFYEKSAVMVHRTDLAAVRRGGYEGMKKRGLSGDSEPDLGPSELHPTAGAVVVGARGPLIAFNVNLNTDDVKIAHDIAAKIRKSRDAGEAMTGVKALGVYLKSRGIAQVSTNITQPHQTTIYDVYTFIEREARAAGVGVLESELIGGMLEDHLIEAVNAAMNVRGLSEKRILDRWM